MIFHILFSALLLAISGVSSQEPPVGEWHPAVFIQDVRSPCPVLNALANHGYINRNGHALNESSMVTALNSVVNVSMEISTTLFKNGMRTSSDPASGTFSLADLTKHNIIEHDASMSRKDKAVNGDNFSFCPEVFAEFMSHFDGVDEITIGAAAAARWARVKSSKGNNPEFTYPKSNQFSSYLETAVLLELFRNATTMTTKKEFVKILFEQERFPFDEGWKAVNVIDGGALAGDVLSLALATPEKDSGVTEPSLSFLTSEPGMVKMLF